MQEIAKSLGVNPEEIKNIDEIDLEQEIKEESDNEDEKDDNQEENKELESDELKGLNIKEYTSLRQDIKGETLENKLGLKEKGITDGVKLARVSTDNLRKYLDNTNTQVDSFVVIRKDGTAQVLGEDIIKPDSRLGTNPVNQNLTINNDGTVTKKANTSSYEIANRPGEYLQIGHDEMSGKEIKYSMYSKEEAKYVSTELNTQRTLPTDNEVRQFLRDRGQGEYEATDILERDRQHGECEEKDVTVIDNDKNNDSHIHEEIKGDNLDQISEDDYIPGTEMTWGQFANECGYRFSDRLEKAVAEFNSAEGQTNQEKVDNAIEEINNEYNNGGARQR